jgi:putative membrane protein
VHGDVMRGMGQAIPAGHGGPASPYNLWTAWNIAPSICIPLFIAILIYVWGIHNAWRRAGRGRGITTRQWMSFAGAILVLVLVLMSPLDTLSEALFSVHMLQHLILMLVAAPLLVVSDFQLALLWALPRGRAQALGSGFNQSRPVSGAWRVVNSPVFVWIVFTAAMWLWHASSFYQAALRNEWVHVLEHLTILITAMLFWWILFKHTQPDHIHYAVTIPFLFLTVLQSGILGALMTFTDRPWYSYYMASVTRWGLTPLQDQQFAGLIMWIFGGTVFTLLTIGYFAAWLRALEQRSTRLPHRSARQTHYELKTK